MCGASNSERESKIGGEVIRKGFLEDVQRKILKVKNNPEKVDLRMDVACEGRDWAWYAVCSLSLWRCKGRFRLPCSSTGKESACNAGDLRSIPGRGRSPGEGRGYPLQYSWASLLAQTVENSPAMRET